MKKSVLITIIVVVVLAAAAIIIWQTQKGGSSEILIGANYEMSGAVATFGQACDNSAQMAVDEINEAGGLLGKTVKLVSADNKSDSQESASMATKLITQDKVVAVLGPVTSTNDLAAAPVCQDKGIPMVTPTGTNPAVTDVGSFIFRACFIDDFQGTVMAKFATDTLGAKTAAILTENTSDYSIGLANFFKQTFTEMGGEIVDEEAYMSDDKDFRTLLDKVKSTNPDVLYVPAYYQTDGLIAKQAREIGMEQPILGGDGWDSPDLIKIAGPEALNNVFFSNHFSREAENPIAQDYMKKYNDRFGMEPDALAALGYDAAKMLLDAIKRAGSTDPDKIRQALAETKDFEGVTGTITLNEKRNPVKSAVVIELKDGVQTYRMTVEPS